MPASPRDFLLYSRMTGAPMPQNARERMQMAPEVYQFTKDFARKPNLLEKTGNLARSIGRGAVMAIGAPMVAESLAAEADRKEMPEVTLYSSPLRLYDKTPAKSKEFTPFAFSPSVAM